MCDCCLHVISGKLESHHTFKSNKKDFTYLVCPTLPCSHRVKLSFVEICIVLIPFFTV